MAEADDDGANAWSVLTPEEFERVTISSALAGDRDAAIGAIGLAVSKLATGGISMELGTYIATALDLVLRERDTLTGNTFLRAFNLTRPRKRPEDPRVLSRNIDIAAWVHIAQTRGMTHANAKSRAADLFAVENIDRILRDVQGMTDVNEDAYEELFAARGTPLPSRH